MAKALPPLTWFRAFEAAARRLSFTAAAEEIGMTQSAVSQHVKSLESRFGVVLFIRQARGLSLTDDARKLLPQVEAALETLAAASRTFETGPSHNLLTVASSVSVAQWMIAPRLATFTEQHPNVRLRFLSTIWPDDFQNVRADVEIPFGSEKQFGPSAEAYGAKGLMALKSPKLKGALHELPLIETVGTSTGWDSWPKSRERGYKPQIFVDSFGAALNMAVNGNGVALVSEVLAQVALQTGQLVKAHDATIACQEGYYLRINEQNTVADQFRDWLMEQMPPNVH
jgi:LysR family transcriptional regulator, glycine cleavage system transcriptional activator